MDFTNMQIAFILGVSISVFLLLVWHDKVKAKKLASIEQTTWEPWMDYEECESDNNLFDEFGELRLKFLDNYDWVCKVFGVRTCLNKDDNIRSLLNNRLMFNYKLKYMFSYESHMPSCFRACDFKNTITELPKVGFGTKGAELFMREFNEKVEDIKNYAEKSALEIKYGFGYKYPKDTLINCITNCTMSSKYAYENFFDVKSSLLPELLKDENFSDYFGGSWKESGGLPWKINRQEFLG